jgi:DNA repair protein RadD
MLTLRPYQHDLLDRTRAHMRAGTRKILIQSSTGSGKTCLVAQMLKSAAARGKRAWFVNHRRELVRQSVLTLTQAADLSVGIVQSGVRLEPREPVQVCAIQSLARRLDKLPTPDIIVLDEAHHTASKTWAALIAQFPHAFIIGTTASPMRLDGRGLGAWFDVLVEGPSTADLIAQGWLAPYRLIAPPTRVDLSGVHTVAGDYNKHEAADAMQASTVVGDALSEYQRRAAGTRALLFLWSIAASQETVARFQHAGIAAAHVDGTTPERERDSIMSRFRSGTLRVLSNVDLVSEGFDVPDLDAVFLLRPTASLGLYLQQVGRALRPAPGKTALIVDHVGNYTRHGLPDDPRVWSLDGAAKAPAQTIKVKTCPRCYAVERVWASRCSQCGAPLVALAQPREVEQVEGELAEVDINALRKARGREEGQCRTLEELQALGRARGYKPGWANFRWQARLARMRGRLSA